jgi:hypothetical protein
MEMKRDKIDLEGKILKTIETKHLKMRPRWEFVAEKIGLESALILTLLVISTLFSLLFLYSKANEIHRLLEFGTDGWWYVFVSFPYEIFLIITTLIFLLNMIARKLEFSYKIRPAVWYGSMFILFIAVTLIAEIIGAHNALYDYEENNELPLLKPYFSRLHNITDQSIEGDVLETNNDGFIIHLEINHQPTTTIIHRSAISCGHTCLTIKRGDRVRVIGKPSQEKFEPWGVYTKPAPVKMQ